MRARAVRLVLEPAGGHGAHWAAIASIAAEIGCTPETPRLWVEKAERDSGRVGKAEVIHQRGPWRSFEAVAYAALEWIDWLNNRRLSEPIGTFPPAEADERWWAEQEQADIAACLKPKCLRRTRRGSFDGQPLQFLR